MKKRMGKNLKANDVKWLGNKISLAWVSMEEHNININIISTGIKCYNMLCS